MWVFFSLNMPTKLKDKYMWAHFVVSLQKELDHHQIPYNEQILKCCIFIFSFFLSIWHIRSVISFLQLLPTKDGVANKHILIYISIRFACLLFYVTSYLSFHFFLIFYHNFPLQLFNVLIPFVVFFFEPLLYLSNYYFFYVDSTRNKWQFLYFKI